MLIGSPHCKSPHVLYSQIVNELRLLASTQLWTARMDLAPTVPRDLVQRTMTRFVTATGISVVGYATRSPNSLTLLHWPDTRPDYHESDISECELALDAMAGLLNGSNVRRGIVPPNTLHCMMGRGKDGYSPTDFVPLTDFERTDIAGYHVKPGHMVSARAADSRVEEYGERVGILTMPTSPANEQAIKNIGIAANQWHFAIEHGVCPELPEGRTDFWETSWVQAS